jgi:hypothetical protein
MPVPLRNSATGVGEIRPFPEQAGRQTRCPRVTNGSHAMSFPLLLRIGLFLCVHVGIVAGVLAFP